VLNEIIELFKKELHPYLDSIWSSLVFWRRTALVLLTGIAIIVKFRRKIVSLINRDSSREHDRRLFSKAQELFDEQDVEKLLDDVLGGHTYSRDVFQRAEIFNNWLRREENQFLRPRIRCAAMKLREKLTDLLHFLRMHFFVFPDSQDDPNIRYRMYPEKRLGYGGPKDIKFYDQHARQLNTIAAAMRDFYSEYRRTAKDILHV